MKRVSLLFAGDVMAHDNQLKAAYDSATAKYQFDGYFRSIEKRIKCADIAVCNLETTIAGGVPTGYPRFNTPEELADAIAQAGFGCVAAANNHSLDSDLEGIIKTRKALEKRKLQVIGIRKAPREKAYTLMHAQGVRIALLNYTYETAGKNGKRSLNNRPFDDHAAALLNSFGYETIEADLDRIAHEVASARKDGAQVVIMYYHWGNEYERYSNVFQRYVAWRTACMGVDAIIGSHAHVMQELSEIQVPARGGYKKVPVFYGLGNYIWGAPPMMGRDTVLNNILALLDIQYHPFIGKVKVTPSYIPMFIAQEDNRFSTVDLDSIAPDEYESFQAAYGYSVEELRTQIRDTVENRIHPAPAEFFFKTIFRMKTGERRSLLDGFLPSRKYVRFRSEDAIIASVTKNGYVIGNSAGYVGITAVAQDGTETLCMVHVSAGQESTFPILVNADNSVRDIYQPPRRLAGEKHGLPEGISLCENAALAWKAMEAAALSEGVALNAVSAFRTKKAQLQRRNKFTAVYGEAATNRRYQPIGCSEHHLGVALDINGGVHNGKETPKATAINWVQRNCHKFGFVARKIHSTMENIVYIHVRYLDDRDLVHYLTENKLTLEEYLTDYDRHRERLAALTQWQRTFIEPGDSTATLSLHKICNDILDIPVPWEFRDIAHRVVPQILLSDAVPVQRGSVFFFDRMLSYEMRRCRNALRSGAVAAFAREQIMDELGNPMPTIIVPDPLEACTKVGRFIRDQKPAKTVCITGSAGKSTTTELVYHILASRFRTHMSKLNNANNRVNILQLIQTLKPEHEMYVQEVGGSFPDHIAKGAQMLQPDVAIITNIGEAHLDLYKSFENIKKDKLSLLDNRRPGGIGLLNIDNIHLRERAGGSAEGIITYSLQDPAADYYGTQIRQDLDGLKLIAVEKSTGLQAPICVNIVGEHNAYNALAAFAVGRWAGIPVEDIVQSLASYKPKGTRQHLSTLGGYHLLVDCFSSVEISLISAMRTLHQLPRKPGSKKIAVIWGLMRLGDQHNTISTRVAEAIRDLDIDHLLVYGVNGTVLAAEAAKGTLPDVRHTLRFYQLVGWIQQLSSPGDILLFKGQHMQSTALAIDCAFGTDYMVHNPRERQENGRPFREAQYSGVILHNVAAVIDSAAVTGPDVTVPDLIEQLPVVCIDRKAFAGQDFRQVYTGGRVVSIYDEAFRDCSNLADLRFGAKLRYIGKSAFRNCTALKQLELPSGCTHIEQFAFAGCEALGRTTIPQSVMYIADNAFDGCTALQIAAPKDSYAYAYALEHGIPVIAE